MKYERTVWRVVHEDETIYVQRCSRCGYFRKELRTHWFFTGLYCVGCIQNILYDDARTIEELP